jgi:selenide,water dikinase
MIPFAHPWIEEQVAPMEDAALLRPEVGPPLVFSVDFITPIVDDPEAFGAIAAANSMSDIYAMGGDPQIALAVCGYPEGKISLEVLQRIFRGGRDKAAEAGCAIAGGHTMIDPELKYGLCVIGSVDPEHVLSQTGARPGDRLVLTKPIGTGIASQGIKKGELSDSDVAAVIEVMSTLNRAGKEAALASAAHAATDVTGFGLLGHLHNMVLGAGLGARLTAAAVPVFPFTRPLARAGRIPGGTRKNLRYVEPHVHWDEAIDEIDRLVLCDAQTSGGLLLCVPPEHESRVLQELELRSSPAAAVIGEVVESTPGHVEVTP